jgi:nucleoid-associated protein YgaU
MNTIIVAKGDSLWSLAERLWGDGKLWPMLFAANQDAIIREQLKRVDSILSGPDLIFEGTELRVPDRGQDRP